MDRHYGSQKYLVLAAAVSARQKAPDPARASARRSVPKRIGFMRDGRCRYSRNIERQVVLRPVKRSVRISTRHYGYPLQASSTQPGRLHHRRGTKRYPFCLIFNVADAGIHATQKVVLILTEKPKKMKKVSPKLSVFQNKGRYRKIESSPYFCGRCGKSAETSNARTSQQYVTETK